jgi:hypothetical protein
MATVLSSQIDELLGSMVLAGNTEGTEGIRCRPGEPTDNLRKPDYVGQASRRYQKTAANRDITYCLLLTVHLAIDLDLST